MHLDGTMTFGYRPELAQKVDHVRRDAFFVVVVSRPVRKARADGLVDVNQRRVVVPRVRVERRVRARVVDLARAVLAEERDLRRAARAARHPEDDRVRRGVGARFKAPEKQVLVARGEINEARRLRDVVAERGRGRGESAEEHHAGRHGTCDGGPGPRRRRSADTRRRLDRGQLASSRPRTRDVVSTAVTRRRRDRLSV